ncbi:MAG: hypothetical protein R3D03_07755 [Geminicoccaceae bacterium]
MEQLSISQPAISNLVRLLEGADRLPCSFRTTRRRSAHCRGTDLLRKTWERALTRIDISATARTFATTPEASYAIGTDAPCLRDHRPGDRFHRRQEIHGSTQTRTSRNCCRWWRRQLDIAVIADSRTAARWWSFQELTASPVTVAARPPACRTIRRHAKAASGEWSVYLVDPRPPLGPCVEQGLHDAGIHPKVSITTGMRLGGRLCRRRCRWRSRDGPFASAAQFHAGQVVVTPLRADHAFLTSR